MKNIYCKTRRVSRQRGMTLVELMISLALGLFLIAGIVQLFVGSKSTNNSLNALSHLQQNGRISIERLKNSLRMAGYMGCSNLSVSEPEMIALAPVPTFTVEAAVQGEESSSSTGSTDPIVGTDVLTIITSAGADADLSVDMSSATDDLTLTSNPSNLEAGDTLVISDCENYDVFVATNVDVMTNVVKHGLSYNSTQVNKSTSLSKVYRDNALVLRIQQVTYAVRDTNRLDKSGNPILALFETRGIVDTEIVTGVEDMQITYGVDTSDNGAADDYRTADLVTAALWGSVVSVRIALLVSTEGDRGGVVHPFTYEGATSTTHTDDRIRREFTTTVNLRNRTS